MFNFNFIDLIYDICTKIWWIIYCRYPLTLYQKITYPVFIIKILDTREFMFDKKDFIEEFVYHYINDAKYRKNAKGKYVYLVNDLVYDIGDITIQQKIQKEQIDRKWINDWNSFYIPK